MNLELRRIGVVDGKCVAYEDTDAWTVAPPFFHPVNYFLLGGG